MAGTLSGSASSAAPNESAWRQSNFYGTTQGSLVNSHAADTEKPDDEEAHAETVDETKSDEEPSSSPTSYSEVNHQLPPNGGYGWVVAVCVALINGHTWGLNSSYGVFLAHYLANNVFPGATSLDFAFVGSLSIGCALLVSPAATFCVKRFGTQPTMLAGVVMETASLICASLAKKIWHLFLTQGVLFGLGMGFLFVPSVTLVPQWFTTRRSLANGIATCGSGLGGVLYSLAAGAMIQNLGLNWACRILGILAFVGNTTCTLLVKDRNKLIGSTQLAFEVSLFKKPEYLLVLGFGWFSMLGYVVLIFSLANYANHIGLGSSQAALVSAMFNLGQGLGRTPVGYFSDRTGRINMASFGSFLTMVFVFAIWINAKQYGVLIFFAIVGGMVAGTFWATIAPVMAEVVGLQHVASGLNILWLVIVVPCVCSEPIALEIVNHTGGYLGTQLFTGFMYFAAAACLFILRGWKIVQKREIAAALGHRSSHGEEETKLSSSDIAQCAKAGRTRMLQECWKAKKI